MPIRWTELAIFDLEQAREYIMQTSPEKAIVVIDRIEILAVIHGARQWDDRF
jgi:plasmid stabilization system protein ParE